MKPTDPPPPPQASPASHRRPARAAYDDGVPPYDHAHEELHNEDVAHEHSDINVRGILMFVVAVTIVGVVSATGMAGLFWLFQRQAAANDPKVSPLAVPATTMPRSTTASPYFGPAPQPQLLTNEPAALRQLRETEDQALHQYGWVDQAAGVARVPIDQAKKLLIERGLPSRPAGVDPKLGTHAPAFGEATGGRTIPTGAAPAAPPGPGGGH